MLSLSLEGKFGEKEMGFSLENYRLSPQGDLQVLYLCLNPYVKREESIGSRSLNQAATTDPLDLRRSITICFDKWK